MNRKGIYAITRKAAVPLLVFCAGMSASEVIADDLLVYATPAVAVEGGWDSNVFNTRGGPGDWYTTVRPTLELGFNIKGTMVRLHGGIEAQWYRDYTELNQISATQNYNLAPDAPIPLSSRFSITPAAYFLESDDIYKRNAIVGGPSAPADSVATPVPVVPDASTKEYSVLLDTSYQATQHSTVGFGVRGIQQDVAVATATQGDSRSVGATARWDYAVSPKGTAGISVRAARTWRDQSSNTDELLPQLTGKYMFSPSIRIDFSGGANYVRDFGGGTEVKDKGWTPSGRISISYTGRVNTFSLSGEYLNTAVGNFGQLNEKGLIQGVLTTQWSSRWSTYLWASLLSNRFKPDENTTEDIKSLGGTATVTYRVTEILGVHMTGTALRQRVSNILFQFEDLERYTVILGFDVGKQYKIF